MTPTPKSYPRPLSIALSRYTSIVAVASALGLATDRVSAVDLHWDATGDGSASVGGTGTWDLVTKNWDPTGNDPAAPLDNVVWNNDGAGVAIFGGLPGLNTVTVSSGGVGIRANRLIFNIDGYSLFSDFGETLTLAGAAPTVTVTNAADTATIFTPVGGISGLTKTGAGTLSLRSFNTFTGGIFVTAGTLDFDDDSQLGDFSNNITLDGGKLANVGSAQWDPNGRIITIGPGGGALGGSQPIRINEIGQIVGAGTLIRDGSTDTAGLDIAVPNEGFTGNIVVNGGTLELKHEFAVGSGANQTVTVNGGQLSLAGRAGGVGGTLFGKNITLSGGALSFNNIIGGSFTGNVNVTADSGISVKNFYNTANQGGAINGVLSGTGKLTVTGSVGQTGVNSPYGSVLLTNPGNTYSGTISIGPAAQVRSIQGGGVNALATAKVELAGGTLGLAPKVAAAGASAGVFGRYYNSTKFATTSGGTIGGFDFGTERVALTRNDLTIDYPTTAPSGPGVNTTQVGMLWTGILEVESGGSYQFYTRSDDGSLIFVDGQLVTPNDQPQGPTERSGAINLSPGFHSIIIKYGQGGGGGAMTASYNGPDSGNTKVVLGSIENTLTNNGANLFAPTTMANSINVVADSAIDLTGANATSSGTLTFSADAGLQITGVTGFETLTQAGPVVLSGSNRITAGVNLPSITTTVGANYLSAGADLVITGAISEATPGSGIIKDGPRKLTLAGTRSFTGSITINEGTLAGGIANLSNALVVNTAGTLQIVEAANATFTGSITGDGTVVKSGAGTLTINSNQAFTGLTRVEGGAIAGTGTLAGAVEIERGAAINGTSGSTFTVAGLTLGSGSVANVALGAPTLTPIINSTAGFSTDGAAINVTALAGLAPGSYRFVDSTQPITASQLSGLSFGTTPANGLLYGISVNTAASAIDLSVEAAGAANTWIGAAGGTWAVGDATNWTTAYANGQQVTFGDGPTNRNISGGPVAPQRIVVNGAAGNDYVINNAITGTLAGGLQKSGANTLTLAGANTITAPVAISGGTIKLTNTSLASPSFVTGVWTVSNGATIDAAFGGTRPATPGESGSSSLGGATVSLDGGTLFFRGTNYDGGAGGLTAQIYNQQVQRNAKIELNSLPGTTALFNTSTPETLGAPNTGFTDVITDINFPNGFGNNAPFAGLGVAAVDNVMASWKGKFLASLPGDNVYTFLGRSDDGLMVYIDGQLVLNRNNFQGNGLTTGTVTLSQGAHDIYVSYYEGGGGSGVQLFQDADQNVIPLSSFTAAQPQTQLGNHVRWNANSTIVAENTYGVTLGSMQANTAGSTLTTGRILVNGSASPDGLVRFAETSFTVPGTFTVNAQSDVALGTVSDGVHTVKLTKTGVGNIIFDSSTPVDLDGTTIDIQSGRVVAAAQVAGVNPIAGAKIELNGEGAIMQFNRVEVATGFASIFNNPIALNANARIETARHGGGGGDFTLSGGISIAPGKTLSIHPMSGANVIITQPITGEGSNVVVTSSNDPGQGGQFILMNTVNTFTGTLTIQGAHSVRLDNANAILSAKYVDLGAGGRLEFYANNSFSEETPRIISRPGSFFRLNTLSNPGATMNADFALGPGRILEFQAGNPLVGTGVVTHAPNSVFSLNNANHVRFDSTQVGLAPSDLRPLDVIRVATTLTAKTAFEGWAATPQGTILQIAGGNRNIANNGVQEINGQIITNDGTGRNIDNAASGQLEIGPKGAVFAASGGTLTILENVNLTALSGKVTIGTHIPLDNRFGTNPVQFGSPDGGFWNDPVLNAVDLIGGSGLETRVTTTGDTGFGFASDPKLGVNMYRGSLRAFQPTANTTTAGTYSTTIGRVVAKGAATLLVNDNSTNAGVIAEMRLNAPIVRDTGATIGLQGQQNGFSTTERVKFVNKADAPARVGTAQMVAPHFINITGNVGSFVDYDPAQDAATGPGFTNATYTAIASDAEFANSTGATIANIGSAFTLGGNRTAGAVRLQANVDGPFTITSESGGFIVTTGSNTSLAIGTNLAAAPGKEFILFSGGATGGIHTINGTITSDSGFTKFGPRTMVLNADNSATLIGNINVNEASLTINADNRLGAATNKVVLNGGNLRMNADMTLPREVIVNAGGGQIANDGNRLLALTGAITGDGGLTFININGGSTNSGVFSLQQTVPNTFAGGLIVNGMVVEFSRNDQLGALPDVTDYDRGHVVLNEAVATNISSSSTLRLAPGSGAVEVARQFTVLGSPRIDVAGDTDTMTISRDIRGSGGLVKNGPGTLVLNNPIGNGYIGNTVVNGGTLQVTNTSFTATGAGSIILNDTGTFAGNAVVEGSITGNTGSTLSPGVSSVNSGAGSIRTQNGLTLNSDSNFRWTLNDETTAQPGLKFDVVTVDFGSISIASGANFVLEFTGNTPGPRANAFWSQEQTWSDVIAAVDLATIDAANPFDVDNSAWAALGSFSTEATPNGIDLVWTPVPEPGSLLMLVVGGGLFGGFRRHRRAGSRG